MVEAARLAADRGPSAPALRWPVVGGFQLNVPKPDEAVRQVIVSKELLGGGASSALAAEECNVAEDGSATFTPVPGFLDAVNKRVRPYLCRVVDDAGADLSPRRWVS